MRVAYFTDTDRLGGAERVLCDLATGAVAAGHEVVLLAPQQWLLDYLSAAVAGLRTQRVGPSALRSTAGRAVRGASVAGQLPVLARALRALRPDVLHVSNGGYPGSDLCRIAILAGRLAGVPRRLMSVHAVPRGRGEHQPPGQRHIDLAVWSSTHAVVGATAAVRTGLVELRGMPEALYARIPYGVSDPGGADRADALRARLRIDPRRLVVGMVSATSDGQKGHRVLVDAVAASVDACALIVGASPPPDVLARAAGPDLVERVIVAGRVEDVGAAYHAMDVLAVPSVEDESLPLVLLEAMACARPVFGSRLAGIPEVVEHECTGALFPPGDAAALGALIRDRTGDLKRWGVNGRERWAERFSVDAMNRDTLQLYQ